MSETTKKEQIFPEDPFAHDTLDGVVLVPGEFKPNREAAERALSIPFEKTRDDVKDAIRKKPFAEIEDWDCEF